MQTLVKQAARKFFQIDNARHRNYGKTPQVAVYHYRLRVSVTDNANAGVAAKAFEFRLKLGTEIRTLQTMNHPFETGFVVIRSHTATARAGVRVIIRAVKQIGNAALPADGAEKSSHKIIIVLRCGSDVQAIRPQLQPPETRFQSAKLQKSDEWATAVTHFSGSGLPSCGRIMLILCALSPPPSQPRFAGRNAGAVRHNF